MNKTLWLGLAEVKPLPDNTQLEGALGAYAQIVAPAEDAAGFRAHIGAELAHLGYTLVGLEEVGLFDEFAARYELAEEMHQMAVAARADGSMQVGTYHTYKKL